MKLILIALIGFFSAAIEAVSQMAYLQYPQGVSSVDQLKEVIKAKEWWEFEYKGETYHLSRTMAPSFGRTNEVINCWFYSQEQERVFLIWHIVCQDVGSVEVIIDRENMLVRLIGQGYGHKKEKTKLAELLFATLNGYEGQ